MQLLEDFHTCLEQVGSVKLLFQLNVMKSKNADQASPVKI